jgi:Fic family protein
LDWAGKRSPCPRDVRAPSRPRNGYRAVELLYLSHYLKAHRTEYYDRLMAVRNDGDWEGWLRFFLLGVRDTAEEATTNIRAINKMREEHRGNIQEHNLALFQDDGQPTTEPATEANQDVTLSQ